MTALRPVLLTISFLVLSACRTEQAERATAPTLVVFNAGSLALPIRAALDSFVAREHIEFQQENAGSLETARKLTALGKIPDIIALADYKVFAEVLMPAQVTWYAQFARNAMVLAFSNRSRGAAEITAENWPRILSRRDVQVGRADPNLDPNGYRTVMVLQLAEAYYHQPGLAARLLASSAANVRPKEVDLLGLLQAGELDYIWSYESIARAAGLRSLELPAAINLGSANDSARYATTSVRVTGRSPRDSVTMRGEPIVYGFSIPRAAPHRALAERFASYLLSPAGRAVLRAANLDALEVPRLVGDSIPAAVRAVAGQDPRSATIGSTRAARRAGIQVASRATAASTNVTPP